MPTHLSLRAHLMLLGLAAFGPSFQLPADLPPAALFDCCDALSRASAGENPHTATLELDPWPAGRDCTRLILTLA